MIDGGTGADTPCPCSFKVNMVVVMCSFKNFARVCKVSATMASKSSKASPKTAAKGDMQPLPVLLSCERER